VQTFRDETISDRSDVLLDGKGEGVPGILRR
jgi:hypothetical protein